MVEIKKRKLITIGNGQGFLIPKAYLKDNMKTGLELNKEYDVAINERQGDEDQ